MALHSRSKSGEVVLVQQPGKLNVGKLKELGVQRQDVVRYFCYHLEYCAQKLDPNAKVLMVVDFANLGFGKFLSGDFLSTIKAISDTIGAAFCRRVSRYVIVNPPGIMETVFQLVSTLLPAGARDNCTIAKDAAALEVRFNGACAGTGIGGNLARVIRRTHPLPPPHTLRRSWRPPRSPRSLAAAAFPSGRRTSTSSSGSTWRRSSECV